MPPTRESANGKPSAPAPVIRAGTFDDREPAMWKRLLPAFVISGGFHVILAAFGVVIMFLFVKNAPAKPPEGQILETKVEEQEEKDKDLINPEVGLDPDQQFSNDSERMEEVTVNGETNLESPVGDPNTETESPVTSPAPGDVQGDGALEGDVGESAGMASTNPGGAAGKNKLSFRGNSAARAALTKEQGGNEESEAAVARGLIWLARKQQADGRWKDIGGDNKNDIATTGIAILPFLAAGETHKTGKKYSKNVLAGLTWLTSRQKPEGDFMESSGMYANAIATVALCEAYGMTQDAKLQPYAQKAVNFIVKGQAANGSWGYSAGSAGDTSIVGWQIQALKAGQMANLSVPPDTFKRAGLFLDSVMDSQGTYGYTTKGGSPNLTAVGALLRQYMGWGPKNVNLQKSVEYLKRTAAADSYKRPDNMYCLYYATQVMHFYGGDDWSVFWNPKMRDRLIKDQEKEPSKDAGSWDEKGDVAFGHGTGRVFNTAMCLLTLEVYYRHLPLYRRGDGGFKELEN